MTTIDDAALANRIVRAVFDLRSSVGGEIALQDAIERRLEAADIACEREVRLTPKDKIDFLCGAIGVEVKIDGALAAVTRQVHRYGESDRIRHLVVVTTKRQHLCLPATVRGKVVTVCHLIGGSL